MTKLIAKIAEKYAKTTNTACVILGLIHQPKMPASLIKKINLKLISLNDKKLKNQKRFKKIQLIRVGFFLVYF